jgi:hypothetical protein
LLDSASENLQEDLHLESFSISGAISNGKLQYWNVRSCCGCAKYGAETLCTKVQVDNFAVNGGDFPPDKRSAASDSYEWLDLPEVVKAIDTEANTCWGTIFG